MQITANAFQTSQPGQLHNVAGVFGPDEMHVLLKMARSVAGPSMDADDLLHDAIERALRSWDSFEPGSNLYAWMRTIMYRLAIDQTRGRRRRKGHLERERWALVREATETCDDDEETAWSDLGMEDIRWALAQLPDTLRHTYHRFAIDGRSYYEIGAEDGIPFATVGTRLLRARRKLRELLSARALQRQAPVALVPRVVKGGGNTATQTVQTKIALRVRVGRGKSCGKSASLAA